MSAAVAVIMFFLTLWMVVVVADEYENRLYKYLMKTYNPLERPVHNVSEPVVVSMGMVLQQIVDVDERNQAIEVNAWLKFIWRDEKLMWDLEQYGNVTDLSVDRNFDSTYHTNLVVYYDGTVNWIPPGIFRSSCKMDIMWFPFDDQKCYLMFGSWSYHGYKLDLRAESLVIDTSEYIENGEWLLLGIRSPVNRTVKVYECCDEPYPLVTFHLLLRRRTLYYTINMIVPCLLITGMTVLGFCLPPEAGEKLTMEMTILLSVFFFLSSISEAIPATSDTIPLIGTFFSCVMVCVTLSVVFTVLVLNLHYRATDRHARMGRLGRVVLLDWLPRLLLMSRPDWMFHNSDRDRRSIYGKRNVVAAHQPATGQRKKWTVNVAFQAQSATPYSPSMTSNVRGAAVDDDDVYSDERNGEESVPLWNGIAVGGDLSDVNLRNAQFPAPPPLHYSMSQSTATGHEYATYPVTCWLRCIHKELRRLTSRATARETETMLAIEWRFAAKAVDRLCLYVFTLFIVCSCAYVVVKTPHLII